MRKVLQRTGAFLCCVLASVPLIGSAAAAPVSSTTYTATALQQGVERLTMDKVSRYFRAMTNLMVAAKAHPELNAASNRNSSDDNASGSDAQQAAKLAAIPVAVDALRRAGLTPAQFVNLGGTVMGAAMGAGMLKSYPSTKLPAGVEGDNIRFVEQHSAEIEALQKQVMAQAPQGATSHQ